MKIIKELQMLTGDSPYLFHSPLSKQRPMSNNTLNAALKRLGYKGQMNPHSFRAMFSTVLHENINKHGFHSDIIERQLAHKERNKVKDAYDHSEYLPQRKQLMQWWADWLNEIKAGGEIE
jgi:integrase